MRDFGLSPRSLGHHSHGRALRSASHAHRVVSTPDNYGPPFRGNVWGLTADPTDRLAYEMCVQRPLTRHEVRQAVQAAVMYALRGRQRDFYGLKAREWREVTGVTLERTITELFQPIEPD